MASRSRKPRVRKAVESTVGENANSQSPEKQRKTDSRESAAIKRISLPQPVTAVGRALKRVLGFIAPRYFVNSWREVRQVSWPNRRESLRLTAAVFVFAVIFGGLVAGIDKGLDALFKHLVLK